MIKFIIIALIMCFVSPIYSQHEILDGQRKTNTKPVKKVIKQEVESVGGYTPQKIDRDVIKVTNIAIPMLRKKYRHDLQLVKIISASTQALPGTFYHLRLLVKTNGKIETWIVDISKTLWESNYTIGNVLKVTK